jgi:hypothetical protein
MNLLSRSASSSHYPDVYPISYKKQVIGGLQLLIAIQEDANDPSPYRVLAACYAHMGRLDEARAIVARLRAITPLVVPKDPPFRNPEHRELFLSGLRLAAGEAT